MKTTLVALAAVVAAACSNNVNGSDRQPADHSIFIGDPGLDGDAPNDGDTVNTGGGGDDTNAGQPEIAGCSIFPANHIFNTRIDDTTKFPVDANSSAYIATIQNGHGSDPIHLHADFGTIATHYGIPYNVVHGNALTWSHVVIDHGDDDESDCADSTDATHAIIRGCTGSHTAHACFPIPASPQVEGNGTISSNPNDSGGDAHMPILDEDTCRLWEVGQTRHADGVWYSAWDAAWDLASNDLRPADWTSADAAGFPIMPLLVKADEAATGTIKHAFRYTISSDKIRTSYVWPARHITHNGDASTSKPPMGQLFRVKAGTAMPSGATAKAQAVITALMQYGMYLSDGGSDWYVTGTSSDGWDDDTITAIQKLTIDDFEAVSMTNVISTAGFDADSGAVP